MVRTEVDDSQGEAPSNLTADSGWKPNLEHLAQGGDALSILLHCADSDADPFRQIVAFHCSDNYLPLKHGTENGQAIINIHQNKISGAGDKRKFQCSKFFLEKSASFVG